MSTKQIDPSQYPAVELVIYFICAWVIGVLFQGFSGDSMLGDHPYAGASVLLVLAALPPAWSTSNPMARLIRIAVPIGLVLLFLLQGPAELGVVARLQQRIGPLHFVFLFSATFFSVLLTGGSEPQPSKNDSKAKPQDASPKPKPKPDVDAFDRIVGQPHVVKSLEEIANVVRSGIRVGKSNAPHAVLLFLGPTGVGKTEAARALAQAVYGKDDALIRFDMGQFTDAHQANRFYGPPPGYVGSAEGGQLTREVHRQPRSVVLLDEVEKAHTQIWDAFLPVFDEGYIVDGSTNQKVDMTNTIIVLTSNLLVGTEGIAELSSSELKDKVQQTGQFRAELVGRINEVLAFSPLSNDSIKEILRRRVDQSLWSLSDQGVSIFVDDDDIEQMLDEVKEAQFGVRQIDDVVRKYLRQAITEQQDPPVIED